VPLGFSSPFSIFSWFVIPLTLFLYLLPYWPFFSSKMVTLTCGRAIIHPNLAKMCLSNRWHTLVWNVNVTLGEGGGWSMLMKKNSNSDKFNVQKTDDTEYWKQIYSKQLPCNIIAATALLCYLVLSIIIYP